MASSTDSGVKYVGYSFPWLAIFLGIKWFGSALATWSYWWIFLPWVPIVWLIVKKLGL